MHCRTTTGMMEKCNVRLFYGCMFLALFLSLVEVSDTVPVKKPDENLCDAVKFLHETNVMKHPCKPSDSEDYKSLAFRYENMDKFLCLLIEDITPKICSNNSTWWTNLNSTAYYTYMQRLSSQKEMNDVTFCNYLKGLAAVYETSNPTLVEFIKFVNEPKKCDKVCFNVDTTIYQICSMLQWIKSSHDAIMQQTVTTKEIMPVSTKDTLSHAAEVSKQKLQHVTDDIKAGTQISKEASHDQSSTGNKIGKPESVMNKVGTEANSQAQSHTTVSTKSNKIINKVADTTVNLEKPETKDKSVHVASDSTPVKIESTDAGLQGKEKMDDSIDRPTPSITQSGNGKNEEGKTDIISDNTQDQQNTGNEDENDDHIPYGPDEDITSERDNQNPDLSEISDQRHDVSHFHNIRAEDESHFFTYFTVISVVFIGGCIAYHNKQKILAIVLEGRRSKNSRGRRRPSTASYRKLDCTLEEAVTSQCNANVTHVIY